MKTILAIIGGLAIIGLNQALTNQPNQEKFQEENQVQLKNLLWSLRKASALVGQSYQEALTGPKPKPMMMNKIPGLNLPRPSKSFYPFEIRNQELKGKWDEFEYKGLGPVTPRPFTYLDLRIIG